MRISRTVLALIVLAAPTSAFASLDAGLPGCRHSNLREAPVGFKCTTYGDRIFERVERHGFGEAWKSPDGLIWSDALTLANHVDAVQYCHRLDARLPGLAEYKRAAKDGLNHVVPNPHGFGYRARRPFWTADHHPYNISFAYVHVRLNWGEYDFFHIGAYKSVRCVAR